MKPKSCINGKCLVREKCEFFRKKEFEKFRDNENYQNMIFFRKDCVRFKPKEEK